jgi:N-acetylgalactosamine-N,N'-diacetylbacillosaminyl-diphospho-undecaprenol 4-alpha-N-acetylgalactosaminyltransferase
MSCNLPIVTTNCPSGPNEILQEEIGYDFEEKLFTKYGLLVPTNNEKEMICGIVFMMENKDYYENCKASLNSRIQDFDKGIILEKFYNVLSS